MSVPVTSIIVNPTDPNIFHGGGGGGGGQPSWPPKGYANGYAVQSPGAGAVRTAYNSTNDQYHEQYDNNGNYVGNGTVKATPHPDMSFTIAATGIFSMLNGLTLPAPPNDTTQPHTLNWLGATSVSRPDGTCTVSKTIAGVLHKISGDYNLPGELKFHLPGAKPDISVAPHPTFTQELPNQSPPQQAQASPDPSQQEVLDAGLGAYGLGLILICVFGLPEIAGVGLALLLVMLLLYIAFNTPPGHIPPPGPGF